MKLWHLLILIVLVLSACSGNQNTTTTSAGQDNGGQVTATTQSTTPLQNLDASTELVSIMKMKANLQWKVDYEVNAAGNTYTMTQYIKGVKKFRLDMNTNGMESRSYMIDNVVTSCTNINSNWRCYNLDVPVQNETDKAIEANPTDYKIVADGTMSVAGKTAKCYLVTGLKVEGTFRYCYSEEGVPLYVKMQTSKMTTEMTAKSYTTSVADSDFVLPAEATKMTLPG